MARRFIFAVVLVAAAAILALGGTPQARAANVTCTGAIGPATTLTTISGNVTVPINASCTLDYVNVTGNVQVQPGGTLVVSAYDEPSTIGGNVQGSACGSVLLKGNVTVTGNVQISACRGAGPNGFQGPDTVIKGDFQCQSNSGGCEAWLGEVDGNVQVQSNGSATDVSLTVVGGNLQCQSNAPATTHVHGPDWVTGTVQGQCAGFSTTTTSIATPVTPASSCAALMSLSPSGFPVPNTVITSAVDTPASTTPVALPERCIVNGYVNQHISPVDNCEYQDTFQVQLPLAAAWNGRFMFQGGGGTEGSVPTATGTDSGSAGSNFGITNGYAVASQDGGHENSQLKAASCDSGYGNANEFYLDPLGTIGQAYQSIQVSTLVAKYLVNEYYGKGPNYSYWVGCSTGGRQGMVMSQNFPQYFDGIVAGDPVYDQEALGLSETYGNEQILNVYNTASPPLPPITYVAQPAPQPAGPILYPAFPSSDQGLFEAALLQACDALDGVSDGVIDNLPACMAAFNPMTATYVSGGTTYNLSCGSGPKTATCLTPDQIQAAMNIHQGPRTTSGQTIQAPAGLVAPDPGNNTAQGYIYDGGYMTTVGIPARKIGTPTTVPGDFSLGVGTFGYAFLSPADPEYYTLSFNFNSPADLAMLTPSTPIVTNSTSLDISKFINYGHKIIWYHGLSDPGPPVLGTIVYYTGMANQHGGLAAAQSFSRLYGVPNMDHCTGGATTDQFDMLTPVVQWVENGTAPGPVPAKGVNFNSATYQVSFVASAPDNAPTTRSRVLCPYPEQARFTGSTTNAGINGAPIATNPSDLANPANYTCVTGTPLD